MKVARILGIVAGVSAALLAQGAFAWSLEALNPNANATVTCLAVQPDGKILVGGAFTVIAGGTRNHIARLGTTGALDGGFDPSPDSAVNCIVVQPDGKILVAGTFTTICGETRNRIARLEPDGSLDAAFDPNCGGDVHALALRADGKILVAGFFSTVGGATRHMLARLNPDGTADGTFSDPNVGNRIYSLAEQPDGKIVVGGIFTPVVGINRYYLARINADGTLDEAFNPRPNDQVYSVALQKDGRILIGGRFALVGTTALQTVARLEPSGAPDTTFTPGQGGYVYTIVLSADGSIYLGGSFAYMGGLMQGRIARLSESGAVDAAFNPAPAHYVQGIALEADGDVLLGGNFQSINSVARNHIARLTNDVAATQALTLAGDGSKITWTRGGSSPELTDAVFFDSADAANWTPVGKGTRVSGGWELAGIALPANESRFLRADGIAPGGNHDACGSVLRAERTYNFFGYDLSVSKAGAGAGTVTSAPAGIDCGTDCVRAFGIKLGVTLTAVADTGSVFSGWGGSCASCGASAGCAVVMNSDLACTASFAPLPKAGEASGPGYDLVAAAAPGTGVSLSFTPAACATDHAAYWGAASGALAALEWTGAACGLGSGPAAIFDPGDPSPGTFLYFVVVGNNGLAEGSYGTGSAAAPRPDASPGTECLPQELSGTC